MTDNVKAPAHRFGRATHRARARELAQEFVEYAQSQRQRAAALNNITIPPVEPIRLTDEEAREILAQAERVFLPAPSLKPGNKSPKMTLTTTDTRQARSAYRHALEPEPLPPGIEELRCAPIVRNMLSKGPLTRSRITESLNIDMETADDVLLYMLRTSQIAIIGHRKKNGNLIPVYGLPDDRMPPYPLEDGDVEGRVAQFLFRRRMAKFTEIITAIPNHGDTAVMTALHSLMAGNVVTRVGKANQTTYIWTGF